LHDEKLGRTRAQTRKLSTSSEEKPGMKRAGTMVTTAKVVSTIKSLFFIFYTVVWLGGGRIFEKAEG